MNSRGDRIFDLSGKRNHGTNIGGPVYEPVKFGPGLHYNGSTQYSDLGANPSYTNDTKGTIVIWFSLDALFAEDGINQKLYGFGGSDVVGNAGLFGFELRRRDSIALGKTRISLIQANDGYVWPDNVSGFMGNTDLVAGIVYCAALVSDGSAWTIYLDGKVESLTSWGGDANNGDWFGDCIFTAPHKHSIAAIMRDGVMITFFDGKIECGLVSDNDLTPSDIAQIYREPFCMFPEPIMPEFGMAA